MTEKIGLKAVLEDKDFQAAVSRYVRGMGVMDQKTAAVAQSAGGAMTGFAGALTMGLGAAIGIITAQLIPRLISGLQEVGTTLASIGGEAISSAARVKEMAIVVQYLGEQAGYTEAQLVGYVDQLRDAGLRTDVAQKAVAEFTRYNLDLAKALDLVAIAQGVAVLAEEDSSETMRALIDAVLTQNTLMLRRRGIVVAMGKVMEDYAAAHGKVADELSDTERAEAALIAVIQAGQPLIGLYDKAMESASKQLRSMPRYTYELLLQMGMPFQDTFTDAVFLLVDFTQALSDAAQQGGWLNVILVELGQTVQTLAAPLVSFGRTFIGVMEDLGLVFGEFRGPDFALMQTNIAQLQAQIDALEPPDLSKGWEKEADEIADINAKLGSSIRRLWDDIHRAMGEAMADWGRSRARELEDWIRNQNRALEDFRRNIADIYSDLDERLSEMRAEHEKDRAREAERWSEQREQDLKRHEDEMGRLRSDASMAQSKEEWDLIQQLIAQKEQEFQEERALEEQKRSQQVAAEEKEFNSEMAREKARADERAQTMEREFRERREREEEDRRIRLERERQDFEIRMARQREQAERSEADLRAAAAERTSILREEIAESQRRQQESYERQRAMLTLQLAQARLEYIKSMAQMPLLHKKHAEESVAAYERLSDLFAKQLGIEFEEIKKAWDEQDWGALGLKAVEMIWKLDWRIRDSIRTGIHTIVGTAVLEFISGLAKRQAAGQLAWFGFTWASIDGVLRAVRTRVNEIIREFWNLGYKAMEAFGRGMDHLREWIRHVVNQIVWDAINAVKRSLGIGSPSKVFMDLGQNLDLAFAEGIRSLGHLPALEMQRVAAGTMHSVVHNVTYHQQYNLSIQSTAPVEPIVADFHMMQALAG